MIKQTKGKGKGETQDDDDDDKYDKITIGKDRLLNCILFAAVAEEVGNQDTPDNCHTR